MDKLWEALEISSAGRPCLLDDEIELWTQADINLYYKEEKTLYREGKSVLTNMRLFWIPNSITTSALVPVTMSLATISSISIEHGFLSRSGKLRIDLKSKDIYIKLSFKSGGRDSFVSPLEKALARKAWEATSSTLGDRRLEAQRQFSTSHAGIAGIIRRKEATQASRSAVTSQAFSDLDTLMEKAKDVVAIVERYTSSSSDNNNMSGVLLSLGIKSPVTRENVSSSNVYHSELATQLAEFLQGPLKTNGGIITLTDVYCLFNRARGTEMISPDDLLAAASLQQSLKVGMHLRTFDGGLQVIQSDAHSESKVIGTIKTVVHNRKKIDSNDVAEAFKISLQLAAEYLALAESEGVVVRDDAFEALWFYENLYF